MAVAIFYENLCAIREMGIYLFIFGDKLSVLTCLKGRLWWLLATGTSGFGYGSGRLILGFSAGVTSVPYKHKKV